MASINKEKPALQGSDRVFLIGLILWVLAQLIRVIAIPLTISVSDGVDAPGWMYPAILDIVAAALAIPLAFAIWRWPGFTVWVFTIAYFTMSITDHIGALTNLTLIGEPAAFEPFNGDNNPYVAPVVQTFFDILFFYFLLVPRYRSLFFEIEKSKS